jgi:hypothetical protein
VHDFHLGTSTQRKQVIMIATILRTISGLPAFRIYGKARPESDWRVIDVFASLRRNVESRWPILGGTCITWSASFIAVGRDFAECVLREQIASPASRESPIEVVSGRLRRGRAADAKPSFPFASEILAHECGHTYQARRYPPFYLITGALFTWWREGSRWWNWFENEASSSGQFGGIVSGSVAPDLWSAARTI